MNTNNALNLSHHIAGEATSPEHKRFRTLMGKLDQARQRLQQWQEQLPLFSQAWQQRVLPEQERLRQQRRSAALALEQLLLTRRWSKAESKTLTRELLMLCDLLLNTEEDIDADIKALYNRHADVDFDTEAEVELQDMKRMLEEVGGLDFGDDPVASAEELMEKAREQMAQRTAQERQAFEEGKTAARKPPRKKQSAAALRAEEEARQASQTVREVYRKLAAALHPDRVAADASAEERARSTQLMQQANAAYESGDLLALLTLQLQIEQVDTAQASRLAATQVRHFNKVLSEQLKELEAEIDGRQQALQMSFGLLLNQRMDPSKLGKLITEVLQDVQATGVQLANRQRLLSGDPVVAKRFIKQLRMEHRFDDDMQDFW